MFTVIYVYIGQSLYRFVYNGLPVLKAKFWVAFHLVTALDRKSRWPRFLLWSPSLGNDASVAPEVHIQYEYVVRVSISSRVEYVNSISLRIMIDEIPYTSTFHTQLFL